MVACPERASTPYSYAQTSVPTLLHCAQLRMSEQRLLCHPLIRIVPTRVYLSRHVCVCVCVCVCGVSASTANGDSCVSFVNLSRFVFRKLSLACYMATPTHRIYAYICKRYVGRLPSVWPARARGDCSECFRCCRAPPPPLHGSANPAPPILRARASPPAIARGRLAASWTCAARTTSARRAGARAARPASPLAIRCRAGTTTTCITRRSSRTRWSRPRSSRPVACRSAPSVATPTTARCSPL